MTQLIYRGIPHDGTQITPRRTARDLIYRGVRHDGLTPTAPTCRERLALRYRGVPHGAPAAGRSGRGLAAAMA